MPVDIKELERQHKRQAEMLRQAKQKLGHRVDLDREAERKRKARAQDRCVEIPECVDRERRERLEADDEAWLMFYFGPESGVADPFTYKFTDQQTSMIGSFGQAMRDGGDQASAASRGEGKTTICERLTVKYTLCGVVHYTVLFQATGQLANNSLDTIKTAFEENELLKADYPEVCTPVGALENTPHRAHYMLCSGKRHDNGERFEYALSRFSWCGPEIILPNVPGSRSARSIIATRGLDGAVRGLKKKGRRPDLAILDDPDTDNTARSMEQAEKLSERIDKSIGGLGSQTRPIARIMLCTTASRVSVAYRYTDTAIKPSWRGKRFKFLMTRPERADLWAEYIELKKEDWRSDGSTDHATEFYRSRRDEMDAGATVANPNRYADGELSAIQHYFNYVAKNGQLSASTELDNDPPPLSEEIDSELTARHIAFRLSGLDRYVVPPDAVMVVRGIDVGKYRLHYVVRAFCADSSIYTIDYGVQEVHGVQPGSDDGVEHAIRSALIQLHESAPAYQRPDVIKSDGEVVEGETLDVSLTLTDSRYHKDAIVSACQYLGTNFFPAMGHGKSNGCATTSFKVMERVTDNVQPGDGWYIKLDVATRAWIVHCDTDRWKTHEHARWLTSEGKPGAAYLFGSMSDEERRWQDRRLPRLVQEHTNYSKHLTSEAEMEEVSNGILQRRWRTKAGRSANHYFDASYLCNVAANMRGCRLLPTPKPVGNNRPVVLSSGKPKQTRW